MRVCLSAAWPYISDFFLNILVVLHFLAWQSVLAAVILWMLAKDRKVLKELDYVLLLTFVCFFIFVGNMKRIDAVNIRLMELIQGRSWLPVLLPARLSAMCRPLFCFLVLRTGIRHFWRP